MHLKKLLPCLALFLPLLLLWSMVTGQAAQSMQGTGDGSQDPYTLRVGYWEGYGTIIGEHGEPYGYTVELMNAIASHNHWNVEYIPCSWAKGMEMLSNGELDTFGPMQITPQRQQQYDFPRIPAGREFGTLYTHKSNNIIYGDDVLSLDRKVLGTVEDNYYTDSVLAFCEENNIALTLQYFEEQQELEDAFEEGTVDLRVSGSLLAPENSRVVTHFSIEDFYYPTTKGNAFLLEGFQQALQAISQDSLYFDAKLHQKYFANTSSQVLAYTRKEQHYLEESPVIRCGYLPQHFPGEYHDETTQERIGITFDILEAVAEETGLTFVFQPYETMEEVAHAIYEGECDMLLGMMENDALPERLKLQLSNPLYTSSLAFASTTHYEPSSGGIIVALSENSLGMLSHIQKHYPFTHTRLYPSPRDCLNALKRGDVDLVAADTLTYNRFLQSPFYKELTVRHAQYGEISYCAGISQEHPPELLSILNKGLSSLTEEKIKTIVYQHALAERYTLSPLEHLRSNAIFILLATSAFFISVYVYSRHANRKLNKIAYYDPLTGERNLSKFKQDIPRVLSLRKTYAILVIDINKFKSINDRHGYDYGDQILLLVAQTLRGMITGDSLFCRGNADKFFIFTPFLPEHPPEDLFLEFSKKLNSAMEQNLSDCKILVHAGICMLAPGENNINSIIDRANIALKKVKHSHANSFAYYDQSMYDRINRDREIENRMEVALKEGEFLLYLQPKVDLSTMEMAGAEALVRWAHPDGLIPPNAFIPLFEKNGFILNLDFYMLEEVCGYLEQQKAMGKPLFPISINISRAHMLLPETAFLLNQVVSRYDIDPHLIELELTESAFDNENVEEINRFFQELHSYGFLVSIDDFGAGYSSLSLLKDLPIDVLKIDKSFFHVQNGSFSNKECKISLLLESIFSLSKKLHIRTVSEGVETAEQLSLLTQLGCDMVQGYYFARPMPAQEIQTFREQQQTKAKSLCEKR